MSNVKIALLGLMTLIGVTFGASTVTTWWNKKMDIVKIHDHYSQQQNLLANVVKGYSYTDQQLEYLLSKIPSASRARVAIIHGTTDASYIPLLRFDITNVVVRPGHSPGELVSDMPLAQWKDYLATLLKGDCAVVDTKTLTDESAIQRMKAIKIQEFIGCPIRTERGNMLGAIFVSWDETSTLDENIGDILIHIKTAAYNISKKYIDLNGR